MVASRAYSLNVFFCWIWLLPVLGCLPAIDSSSPSALVLTPSSSYAGRVVMVNVDIPMDKGTCDNVLSGDASTASGAAEFFAFYRKDKQTIADGISVESVVLSRKSSVRLRVSIGDDVVPGTYFMQLECSPDERYEGSFFVEQARVPKGVILSPSSIRAGSSFEEITITVDASDRDHLLPFSEQSRVVFQDNSYVTIREQTISENGWSMVLVISVSELVSLREDQAVDMGIAVISGPQILEGVLRITAANIPGIDVFPDALSRPLIGSPPESFTLTIQTTHFSFVDDDLSVVFPDNPGIHVTSVDRLTDSRLECRGTIAPGARLGPAILSVKSEDVHVHETITLMPQSGDTSVRLFPGAVSACRSDNCQERFVLAQVVGGRFRVPLSVTSATPGVSVSTVASIDDERVAVWLDVSHGVTAASARLLFDTEQGDAVADVLLESVSSDMAAGRKLEMIANFEQGERRGVVLELEDGKMELVASASLPSHAGASFQNQYNNSVHQDTKSGISLTKLKYADDAPVGPSAIFVNGVKESLETYYQIEASATDPFVVVRPSVVSLKERTAVFQIENGRGMLFDETTIVQSSDPSVRIVDVVFDPVSERLTAQADVLPGAKKGVGVLYICTGNTCAAASYRKVPQIATVPQVLSSRTLYRSAKAGVLTVSLPDYFAGRDMPIGAKVFDNIGVRVERVNYIDYDRQIEIVFSLSDEPRYGGGWIGVTLFQGGATTVVPVFIAAKKDEVLDTSLTAVVSHEYGGELNALDLGARDWKLNFELPEALLRGTVQSLPSFNPHVSQVVNLVDGVDFSIAPAWGNSAGATSVPIIASMAYRLPSLQDMEAIPVAITTGRGSAVALLAPRNRLSSESMVVGDRMEQVLTSDTVYHMGYSFESSTQGNRHLIFMNGSVASSAYGTWSIDYLGADAYMPRAQFSGGQMWAAESGDFFLSASGNGRVFLEVEDKGVLGTTIGGQNICSRPAVRIDAVRQGLDSLVITVSGEQTCRLVAMVHARALVADPSMTPDLKLARCDDPDGWICSDPITGGAPGNDRDPVYYFDYDGAQQTFRLEAEMGTIGFYLFNVRQTRIISGVSRESDNSYIELSMEPETAMDGCSLVRRDPQSGQIQAQLSIDGVVPSTGRVLVAGASHGVGDIHDTVGVTELEAEQPFLVELVCNESVVDSVQVGGLFRSDTSEGDAVTPGDYLCFRRIGGTIDTNDNAYDFYGSHDCAIY